MFLQAWNISNVGKRTKGRDLQGLGQVLPCRALESSCLSACSASVNPCLPASFPLSLSPFFPCTTWPPSHAKHSACWWESVFYETNMTPALSESKFSWEDGTVTNERNNSYVRRKMKWRWVVMWKTATVQQLVLLEAETWTGLETSLR